MIGCMAFRSVGTFFDAASRTWKTLFFAFELVLVALEFSHEWLAYRRIGL